MIDRWDDSAAGDQPDPVGACAHASRLIGADPDLVLHGGGNSSVKAPFADVTGDEVDALWVKGSGWDMASIEPAGFAPLPLARLHDLLKLDRLTDADMMAALSGARLDPSAPSPSVETLLHAVLPHRSVQHSHADVIVTLTNLDDPLGLSREMFGDRVVHVPYVMPGFDLAKAAVDHWAEEAHEGTVGMVLANHGLFTFGADAREAYRRHVDLITVAEEWLAVNAPTPDGEPAPLGAVDPVELAGFRQALSGAAGAPIVVRRHRDATTARFVARADLASLAARGPLTPDHVIRTKPIPLVGRDVDGYVAAYEDYFEANRTRRPGDLEQLDPAPRVVLDPEWGMLTAGRTAAAAAVAADIYHHTMPVLARAEDHLGGYRALPAGDLFDMEYWELEQAKLGRSQPPAMAGMVAVVTGAASGIGRACAAGLLAQGCAVVGMDRDDAVQDAFDEPRTGAWRPAVGDVTDPEATAAALAEAVEAFGGVDVAVVSAGLFGATRPLVDHDDDEWRAVMAVNVDAVATLFAQVHPLLARSPVGGRVAVIGSKNVPAPGRGAGAYSASKAALTQLARIAAQEWADDGIRVNTVHPDAVFDTGLWSPALLAERADSYGLTVDAYKRRNLLGAEITSADVAKVVVALCGDDFSVTTGAQVPVDGGNERVL